MDNVNVVAAEVDIPNAFCDGLVHGRADLVITMRPNTTELIVVDVKTTGGYSFKLMKDKNTADEKHITQVQYYMKAMNINRGMLLYLNKDNQELHEYEVKRDDAKIDQILIRLNDLKQQFEAKKIPEMPDKTKWKYNICNYCRFKKVCGDGVEAEKK
jgi:CRISPR/Cas system-associated exonuclease Cas4 (RecB family)